MRKKLFSILALLCLTVTSAWADADVTWNSSNVSDIQFWGGAPDGWDSYTKEGVTLRGNAENVDANWANYGYGDGINFNMNASGGYTFTAPDGKKFTKIEMTIYSYDGWYTAAYDNQLGSGWPSGEDAAMTVYSTNKVTWTGDATSTVDLLTDAGLSSFGGATVSSIDFYFEASAEPVASWVGNSAINANGTWYYAGSNLGWCTGGAFNGADLGTITTLSLGGQSQAWAEGNANWNDGNLTMTMGYKIDGGADESLSLNWFEFADNNNKFQSGGSSWAAQDIDISGLTPGNHTIAVWFTRDDKWDSNNSANYVANFTIPTPAATTYTVSVKEGTEDADKWTADPNPAEAGQTVTVTYSGLKKVKSVKAVKKAPAVPSYDNTLNINTYDPELNNWEDVTVPTGKHWLITGTGEATTNVIIIANNATVTLSGVNITAFGRSIICEGNATIILADGTTNNLYAADEFGEAGIEMRGGSGTSLTIQGNTGVLNITSGSGPAIGAGYGHAGCAINIEGGIINATSTDGPGIGAAYNTACGNITISGGTVAATGGYGCPGIGGAGSANCGDITITNGVTSVTATKGSEAPYSIGASSSGSCGTVTIGGVVGAITESPFTYPASAGPTAYTLAESTVGMIVGTNGLAYDVADKDNLPDGVTAAGVVVYKNGANGLAIALTDEASMMDWATACGESGAAAHTPAVEGCSWKLPSQDEWTLVKNANSGSALNSAITSAGGTAIPTVHFDPETMTTTGYYWLSTEGGNADLARIWCINGYDEIVVSNADQGLKTDNLLVRACLAW